MKLILTVALALTFFSLGSHGNVGCCGDESPKVCTAGDCQYWPLFAPELAADLQGNDFNLEATSTSTCRSDQSTLFSSSSSVIDFTPVPVDPDDAKAEP